LIDSTKDSPRGHRGYLSANISILKGFKTLGTPSIKTCSDRLRFVGSGMHVITRKRLNEFADKYPEAKSGLAHWYQSMKQNNIDGFVELRSIFPSADKVGKLTVFKIGGNKVRLIAAIHYNRKKVYIRAILTHASDSASEGKVW
jgi:mRNA interferase HigB